MTDRNLSLRGLDEWITRSPDDRFYDDDGPYGDEEPDPEDCDHEEHETDILVGVATCCRCGHRWEVTAEEVAAECQRIADYHEEMEREARRVVLRAWWAWLCTPFRWVAAPFRRRRKAAPVDIDDEIPF